MKSRLCVLAIVLAYGCLLATAGAQAQGFTPVRPNSPICCFQSNEIAAGSTAVWAQGTPYGGAAFLMYRYNPASGFVEQYSPSIQFSSFSVGGGNLAQADESWAVYSNDLIYHFDTASQTWVMVAADNSNPVGVAVGPGYSDGCHPYEVWVVHYQPTGALAMRRNYCTGGFDSIAGSGGLNLSTGGGEVWGTNAIHQVFRFNPATGQFELKNGSLAQIAVGVDGVWGINTAHQVLEYNPATQVFDAIPGVVMQRITAGGDGVWGIDSQGHYSRYEASTRTFVTNTSLVASASSAFAVGTGGGVWATDTSQIAFEFVGP